MLAINSYIISEIICSRVGINDRVLDDMSKNPTELNAAITIHRDEFVNDISKGPSVSVVSLMGSISNCLIGLLANSVLVLCLIISTINIRFYFSFASF